MASQILVEVGTQIRFGVSGSLSPADDGTNLIIGTPTEVDCTMSGIADGAGRQSAKVDLGENRPAMYEVLAAIDFTGETPTAGATVEFYWLPSTSSTTGNGNVAGNSGADGAAPDGALGSITLDEFKKLAEFIGVLVVHDGAVVQNGLVSPAFSPSGRYGQPFFRLALPRRAARARVGQCCR